METVRPPIAPDVAAVVGEYAERVENRSLLLEKFVLHKAWPVMYPERSTEPIKWDDASRWSFIRMAQNGDQILSGEEKNQQRLSEGRNASVENKEKARLKSEAIRFLRKCSCRQLPSSLMRQKLDQNAQLAKLVAEQEGQKAVLFGELQGRLIVNLSDSLIQNAGICLDRNTGVPYLPGTAVKGVARHVALSALRQGEWSIEEFMTVFGVSEADFGEKGELKAYAKDVAEDRRRQRGLVDFLPANPLTEPKIEVDISTVHYPDYYQSGKEADLARENLRPNSFPVVAAGVRYAFCIVATDRRVSPELFVKAKAALVEAMTIKGFGAKTGAGYGWFKDMTDEVAEELRQREERTRAAREKELAAEKAKQEEAMRKAAEAERMAHLASMSPGERIVEEWNRAGSIKAAVNGSKIRGFAKLDDAEKRAVVEALRMPDGIGHDVWQTLKGATQDKALLKLRNQALEGTIRAYCKNEMKQGKMP